MTHEISYPKMSHLSTFDGTIGVEDTDEGIAEIVVRIPMSNKEASEVYYQLGNMW